MKISNKELFSVDVYRAINAQGHVVNCGDTSFGNVYYDEKLLKKDVACVKVDCMYVPIMFIDTIFDYWDIMSHKILGGGVSRPDQRFFDETPNYRGFFVKNIRPLYNKEGKTSLEELNSINKQTQAFYTTYSELPCEGEAERE